MPVTELPDFAEDLELLTSAALEAGEIAMRFFRKKLQISWKAGFSPVTDADTEVDRFLKETLCAARPDYGWLSEESEDNPLRLSKCRTFVVDPIDGTRSFMEGGEIWCVSVAVVEENRPVAGILVCPARAEVYWAVKGQGAFMNGARLQTAASAGELVLSIPKSLTARLAPFWIREFRTVPHLPSLAYRLAIIATGKIHGAIVRQNSHDWDLAASDLILSEAGAALLRPDGSHPLLATSNPVHGVLVAGTPELTGELLNVVAAAGL